MKRIALVTLSVLLIAAMASIGYCVPQPDGDNNNLMIKAPQGGTPGKPTVVIKLVRYARINANSPTLSSGDVVIWDTNSADGITVSACQTSGDSKVAGVLVTSLQTIDAQYSPSNITTRNWGYMAVSGRVLANVSGAITAGDMLVGDGIKWGSLTAASADGVARSISGQADSSKWGLSAIALAANTSGTATIPVIVKTEN